jgi:hypothetical protein
VEEHGHRRRSGFFGGGEKYAAAGGVWGGESGVNSLGNGLGGPGRRRFKPSDRKSDDKSQMLWWI